MNNIRARVPNLSPQVSEIKKEGRLNHFSLTHGPSACQWDVISRASSQKPEQATQSPNKAHEPFFFLNVIRAKFALENKTTEKSSVTTRGNF